MSLHGLQSAIAALIRCPIDNRGDDLTKFLAPFTLSPQELCALESLAELPELNKYGREQAYGRWELINRHIKRLFHFVDEGLLEELWFHSFEPRSMRVPSDHQGHYDYSLSFLRFLQEDQEAWQTISKHAPPCLQDLIRFEYAEVELRRPLPVEAELVATSLLAHPHFRVLRLRYHIPAIIMQNHSVEKQLASPLILALVRRGPRRDPRIFEIDPEFARFLEDQKSTQAVQQGVKRRLLDDLEAMGLSKASSSLT